MATKQRQAAATIDIGKGTRDRLKLYVVERNRNIGAEAERIIGQYLDKVDARAVRAIMRRTPNGELS
jgi:hypothetical protein